jgi:serine/threonine protein kinase
VIPPLRKLGSGTPLAKPASATPDSIRLIADYDLIERIGAGAYGEVWLARSATSVLRALKIVWRHTFEDDRPFQREFEGIQRFERISRQHPSQLALFHVGRGDGYFYYVMELADNRTDNLTPALSREKENRSQCTNQANAQKSARTATAPPSPGREGRGEVEPLATQNYFGYAPHTLRADLQSHASLPAARVLELGLALTEALAHLHKHGLVHRDVKPSNIIFVNGRPKLADIGLVTGAGDARSIVGTEGYLPPDGPGTRQADIFALGKVLYEAATGMDRREFPKLPPNLREWADARLVFELNEILLRACGQEAPTRYQTAEQMRGDLMLLQRGQSIKSKRAWEERWKAGKRLGLASALLAVVVVGAIFATRELNRTPSRSSNREAQNLYETALSQLQKIPQRQAPEAYTNLMQAIERDPKFIDAWYQLFEIYADSWGDRLPHFFDQTANERWVATNLWKLDRDSAQYHTVNAWISFNRWYFDEAISEALRATQRDPNFVRAHVEYAHFMLLLRGDVETAHKHNDIAASLHGSDSASPGGIATLYYERKFPEVIELLKRAQKLNPHSPNDMLGPAYEALGDYKNAIDAYEECDKLSSDDPTKTEANYQKQRAAFKELGPDGWWGEKLDQLRQNPSSDWNEYEMAKLYARLKDKEEAFKLLEKGCVELHSLHHNSAMVWLLVDYEWDSMRQDPRFIAIVKRMGLGPK